MRLAARALLGFACWLALAWAAPVTLKVKIGPGVVEMVVEDYVAAVLAGECSTFRSDEAIKAMAVAARSYGVNLRGRHAAEGFDLCSTTHCQRVDRGGVTPRLTALAAQTAGEMLWFEGKPAFACYSRSCGGTTEEGAAVWSDLRAPYLRSHADPYCTRRDDTAWRWSVAAPELMRALRQAQLRTPPEIQTVAIPRRTASGRAKELELSGAGERVRMAASSFRFAIGRAFGFQSLRSDLWRVAGSNGRLEFAGAGDGHGAGLCQMGADQMGTEGHGYRDILAFYYPGAPVGLTARGLSWRRLGGEHVSLMTTQVERDRAVLGDADHMVREIAAKYGWTPPAGIELRIYPDIDTFRNATGEPGWVAARTTARRIQLQAANSLRARGVLEGTLRHELLHVFVEAQAAGGLPVWFREGLVGYLDGGPGGSRKNAQDEDVRQTGDEARARLGYEASTARVSDLARRHGLEAVLGWLRAGLPAGVK
ncbi:MAG: SpoIID/LytB domain-containing protein [Candidatus Solibacter sp.]